MLRLYLGELWRIHLRAVQVCICYPTDCISVLLSQYYKLYYERLFYQELSHFRIDKTVKLQLDVLAKSDACTKQYKINASQ